MMSSRSILTRLALLVLLTAVVSGCSVVGGIFKAGFWAGIIVVVLIVAGLLFLMGKGRG